MSIKQGDRVVCINDTNAYFLTKNKTYEVVHCYDRLIQILADDKQVASYYLNRFIPIYHTKIKQEIEDLVKEK